MTDPTGTVAHEAVQYLRAHGEQNTTALAIGLGRSAKRIAQHLSPAVSAGILSRRLEAGFAFYRLGPNSDLSEAPKVTNAVVKVSALATPSIFAYADQRGAAPFSVSLSTDGRATLERHGRVLLELTNAERLVLLQAAQGVAA